MLNLIKTNPIKSIIFILIGLPILMHFINQEVGFCYEKGRILSDEELINIASPTYRHFAKPELVETWLNTYLKSHPECCRVSDKGLDIDLGMKTFKTVYIEYPVITNLDGSLHFDVLYSSKFEYKTHTEVIGINQCGQNVNVQPIGYLTTVIPSRDFNSK